MPPAIAYIARAVDVRWSIALFVAIAASGAGVKYCWDIALAVGVFIIGYGGPRAVLSLDTATGAWITALAAMAGMLFLVLAIEGSRGRIRLHPAAIGAIAIASAQVITTFCLFANVLPGMIRGPLLAAVLLPATIGLVPTAVGAIIWWLAFRYIALPDPGLQAKHAECP